MTPRGWQYSGSSFPRVAVFLGWQFSYGGSFPGGNIFDFEWHFPGWHTVWMAVFLEQHTPNGATHIETMN